MKYFYFTLGWLFFLLGVIGAFLPLLPTTIFMILALWAFSKSSKKLHFWLYNHKVFGKSLQHWQQYRVIPIKAKILAVIMITASMISIYYYQVVILLYTVLIEIVLLCVIIYIITKPSQIPHK